MTSLMKRVVSMFTTHPDDILSIEGVFRNLVRAEARKHTARLRINRGTIKTYLYRLERLLILERVRGQGFRLKDRFRAVSYIEGNLPAYKGTVDPPAPPPVSPTAILHRVNYRLQLSNHEYRTATELGEYQRNGKAPATYLVDRKSFKMVVYPPNGRAWVFLKGDWKPELASLFGRGLVETIEKLVTARQGHVGMADKIPWEDIRSRPIQVHESDGSVSLYRVARSQIKEGEIDVHRKERAPNGELFERWWDDRVFRAEVVEKFERDRIFFERVFEVLALLAERTEAHMECTRKLTDTLTKMLEGGSEPAPPAAERPAPPEDPAYR